MNKKLPIIIISVLLSISIIVMIIFLVKDNKENPNPSPTPTPIVPTMSDEEYIQTEEGRDISSVLSLYGHEIYTNKQYESFNKTEQGVYYASKIDLMNLSYDVSMIDENCLDTDAIIFFDIDNKMNSDYGEMPVVFRITCQSLRNN